MTKTVVRLNLKKIHDLITTFSERLMKLKTWIDPLQSKPQIQAFFHIKNQQGRWKKCGEEVEGTEEVNECRNEHFNWWKGMWRGREGKVIKATYIMKTTSQPEY